MKKNKFKLCIMADLGFEFWADVPGYDGQYQVSTYGRIRSLKKDEPKIMKPSLDKDGYERVMLSKNGKGKWFYVHRIVGMAFLPRFDATYDQINHKSEYEKANNKVDNIEWCDRIYNLSYGTRNQRIGKTLKEKNYCGKSVLQFDLNENFINEWSSAMEVQRQIGFDHTNISKCCLKKCKTAYKYIWKFKEDSN